MIYYIYDGSFEGLLTAIYQAYYRPDKPDVILPAHQFEETLFAEQIDINTDENKSDKVFNAIRDKISPAALKNVYYAFLSEDNEISMDIYHYLRLGWKIGKDIDRHLTKKPVLKIHNASQRVGKEKHRMLGLLRFQLMQGGIYYGPLEPDHNIIALMAPHFAKRLSGQRWVMHDLKRNLAVLYNGERWLLTALDNQNCFYSVHESDELYQKLWKEYHQSAVVPGRINPRLQRSFMPVRYWRYLVELH